MRKRFTAAIILTILITSAYADITGNGDSRVRPHLDIIDLATYGKRTDNIHYFYRAPLNIAVDIGEGYFFKTKLGYNAAANFAKLGTGTMLTGISLNSAGCSDVSLLNPVLERFDCREKCTKGPAPRYDCYAITRRPLSPSPVIECPQ